jgi:FAD binding domain
VSVSCVPNDDAAAVPLPQQRLLLARDSAHLFSPLDGQGLGLGLRDPTNLASSGRPAAPSGRPSRSMSGPRIRVKGWREGDAEPHFAANAGFARVRR